MSAGELESPSPLIELREKDIFQRKVNHIDKMNTLKNRGLGANAGLSNRYKNAFEFEQELENAISDA